MSLRDNAIVAYAETKVMEKSDRDVFALGGEILEALSIRPASTRTRSTASCWRA